MNTAYSKILEKLGIQSLNEMQEQVIDSVLNKSDIVLISPTGSGKTLAFLLPLIDLLDKRIADVQALILTPTRELALQTEGVFKSLGTSFKINCCYGGHPISIEKNNLTFPPAVLIGTPGRIADHIRRGRVNTRTIRILILDEFDKCLELGFQDDMAEIISLIRPTKRILTSATNSIEIPEFTGIRKPLMLNFEEDSQASKLKLHAVYSDQKDKLETLYKLICTLGNHPMLVFCNHREAVQRISSFLWLHQIPNDFFHGGMEQPDREKALIQFRNGSVYCLVTTDLAARGLDVPGIDYIIHYHLPTTAESFVHRNGRTARMNASGSVFLIFHGEEKIPGYLDPETGKFEIPQTIDLPELPGLKTLFIGAGKKDKINKVDIVGFLIQKGKLKKEEIGRIDVLDFTSYVAVKSDKINEMMRAVEGEAIKKKKVILRCLD